MPIKTNIPFIPVGIAIITISDTRTNQEDTSGAILRAYIEKSGHTFVEKCIVRDDKTEIIQAITQFAETKNIDVILTTGGTGVTARDVTPEALESIADKIIPGFGEMFRMLSYQKIGTSTIQSRAIAGIVAGVYVFCLPGSNGAVKDAWNMILSSQLDNRHTPCNFIELLTRL